MSLNWKHITPKDGYEVQFGTVLCQNDIDIVAQFYKPIIGSNAFSLLMTLIQEVPSFDTKTTEKMLKELLELSDLGIPDFFQSLLRLEGIGLVKTFQKSEEPKSYLYEIQAPSTPKQFFEDDVLSLLLLELIGENNYIRLKKKYTKPSIPIEFKEITHQFGEVYQFNIQKIDTSSNLLDTNSLLDVYDNQKSKRVKLEENNFDWNFLIDHIKTTFINKKELDESVKQTIFTFHQMFGLDELDALTFLKNATDIVTGSIDKKKFKNEIYRYYKKTVKQDDFKITDTVERIQQASHEEKKKERENLLQKGFNSQHIEIIQDAKKNTPAEFLMKIKQQKGGFVTRNEQWTLEDLIKDSSLSMPVINILVHYVLVIKKNAIFERNLANKIANDWAQNSIQTPEEAINKVIQLYKENQSKKIKQNNKYTKKDSAPRRKETLPNWAKEENQEEEVPLSEEEKQAFIDRLNKLSGSKKAGD
ncbi:replication initiation and membrane attachment family protein [Lacticigenium naphthae]|uniref:replication initiation and membrane attachment family protein n=1 Tax=Lacticigenium naphthae TaxID=515351 RepID=UPI0004868179|nr:DnaD domain protein [Lacticigenium naphthae]